MEELQVIETTSGRQFKPWASREDVQAIERAVEQAVQDPASVTAVVSEIASGKQAIAAAINAKGGSASATESFQELAQDIIDINESFITYGVEVTEKINWLKFICDLNTVVRLPLTAIDDGVVTTISQTLPFRNCTALESVKMTALTTISSGNVFYNCAVLQEVNMPNLTTISGNEVFVNCANLRRVYLPSLTTISSSWVLEYCYALKELVLGKLTSISEPFRGSVANLRNVTIGQDTNINLPFQQWAATNVIAEGQSGIDELNTNLQTNLIAKLYQGGGKILRLGTSLYDVTTQETRDMVTAKGWTLQRG